MEARCGSRQQTYFSQINPESGHYPHMAMNELVFAPLGGVGEIGMNFALYGYGPAERREWIIVDCGVTFPGPDLPGVDLVMPDIRYVRELGDAVKGIVITHAH